MEWYMYCVLCIVSYNNAYFTSRDLVSYCDTLMGNIYGHFHAFTYMGSMSHRLKQQKWDQKSVIYFADNEDNIQTNNYYVWPLLSTDGTASFFKQIFTLVTFRRCPANYGYQSIYRKAVYSEFWLCKYVLKHHCVIVTSSHALNLSGFLRGISSS